MGMGDSNGLQIFSGLPTVRLTTVGGSRAIILQQGAHVVSWVPAGLGEQLYLSPKSAFQPGQAVRGGVPVIFPQFAERGPYGRHGFARTQAWVLDSVESRAEEAVARLRLTDTEQTRSLWPHRFELILTVRLRDRSLEMTLGCHNPGSESFDFTAALHTYLGVDQLAHSWVYGLEGVRFQDSARVGGDGVQGSKPIQPAGEWDRIYWNAQSPLELREQTGGSLRRVAIRQQGFQDVVVWNPGPEKCAALKDIPADGYQRMLCIEAAQIAAPVRLAPGQAWSGRQILEV
jgi:glucose-6-phosphate 1-epimerase